LVLAIFYFLQMVRIFFQIPFFNLKNKGEFNTQRSKRSPPTYGNEIRKRLVAGTLVAGIGTLMDKQKQTNQLERIKIETSKNFLKLIF
jgi:hypothetical protein